MSSSKPKIPPTAYGYSLWKQYSMKDIHVRYFSYTFKDVQAKHIKDQEESQTDKTRELQKFVYDTEKRELSVTFSGHVQSGIIDEFVKMMRESVESVPTNNKDFDIPYFHTNVVSSLFPNPGDQTERYKLVGDLLVTNKSGPVFAVETATRHSYPSIKEKVKKWFLPPSVSGVLLVHLNESNGYWKPSSRPPEDEAFLVNSWAWLNYIVDINDEEIDLFDCSKPVEYCGHTWLGSFTCALELYERDFSTRSGCAMTKRYEFVVPGEGFDLEVTEGLKDFEKHLSEKWTDAVEGEYMDGFKPLELNWKQLAQLVAKNRLQLAYERYKAWYKKYQRQSTTSSLGKRHRGGAVESNAQEVRR